MRLEVEIDGRFPDVGWIQSTGNRLLCRFRFRVRYAPTRCHPCIRPYSRAMAMMANA